MNKNFRSDGQMVRVWDNDIERAIRLLRRKLGNGKVFQTLKTRQDINELFI